MNEETMTVGELVTQLLILDQNKPVAFAYPYGDRTRSTIAGRVEEITAAIVGYSEYHLEYKVMKNDGEPITDKSEYDGHLDEEDLTEVVLIT